MLTTAVLALALAATGLSQTPPAGYRRVFITSAVDSKFVVVAKAPIKNGTTTVVQTSTNSPDQTWYLTSGASKIMLANSTLCLDAGAKSNWKDMGNLYVNTCEDGAASQNFNVQDDGRIALVGSSPLECLDLQYMRATANNPVGLYACAGLNNAGAKDKGINWPLVNSTTF